MGSFNPNPLAVGTRVQTREGYPGVVTEVNENPYSGTSDYTVVLDAGAGGGHYSDGEIWPLDEKHAVVAQQGSLPRLASEDYPELGTILADRPDYRIEVPAAEYQGGRVTGSRSAAVAEPVEEPGSSPYAQKTSGTCANCGGDLIYTVSRSQGSHWVHSDTYKKTCPKTAAVGDYLDGYEQGQHSAASGEQRGVPFGTGQAAKDFERGYHDGFDGKPTYPSTVHVPGATPVSAVFLPLDGPQADPAPTTIIAPGEEQGWQDGWADATAGSPRAPENSTDALYLSGYELGWAEGIKGRADIHVDEVTGLPPATAGGFLDFLTGNPAPTHGYQPGNNPSYDWCRFRKNSRCFFSKTLNKEATTLAGYAVWVPEDRGFCPRPKWSDQQVCPVAEPGSHVPEGYLDATVPWDEGGQRGGIPSPGFRAPITSARVDDHEIGWHITASWTDVRAKAKRIRAEGGVRIVAAKPGTIAAEVKGDHHIYETRLTYVPGRQAVGAWECGCAWAAYSWGRRGPFKRFEGRMCSHALASSFEAQARGMFGKTIHEDRKQPPWAKDQVVRRDGDWDRDKARYTSALRPVAGQINEEVPPSIFTREAVAASFLAAVRGVVQRLLVRGGEIVDKTGKPLAGVPVTYPTYHPTLGLDYRPPKEAAVADDNWLFDETSDDEAPFAAAGPNGVIADDSFLLDLPDDSIDQRPDEALPVTYGDEEEEAARVAILAALSGAREPSSAADLLAAHTARMQGLPVVGKDPFAHLKGGGGGDSEVAAAAKAFLAKSALKDFTPVERAQIIGEGEGMMAANLSSLDIEGTHYVGQSLAEPDDDSLAW